MHNSGQLFCLRKNILMMGKFYKANGENWRMQLDKEEDRVPSFTADRRPALPMTAEATTRGFTVVPQGFILRTYGQLSFDLCGVRTKIISTSKENHALPINCLG